MWTSLPLPESERYRARALECRATAGLFRTDITRGQMLKAAADFECIAEETRNREIAQGISQLGNVLHQLHAARRINGIPRGA